MFASPNGSFITAWQHETPFNAVKKINKAILERRAGNNLTQTICQRGEDRIEYIRIFNEECMSVQLPGCAWNGVSNGVNREYFNIS